MRRSTNFLSSFTLLILFSLTGCISLAEDIAPPPGMDAPPLPQTKLEPQPTVAAISLVFPQSRPDTGRGNQIYLDKCAPCHGVSGMGDGPDSSILDNPVPALGSEVLARGSTPADWYLMVTQGNMQQFMPPFSSLSDQERWDVVAFLYSLSAPEEIIRQGETLFLENCSECHGDDGRQGVVDLADLTLMSKRSEENLFSMITEGHELMPQFDDLSEDDRWMLASYLRSLSFFSVKEGTEISEVEKGIQESGSESISEQEIPSEDENIVGAAGNVVVNIISSVEGVMPSQLEISLRGYDEMTETFTLTQTLMEGSNLQFEDIPMPVGRMYFATVDHEGAVYGSDIITIDDTTTDINLEITYYPATSDISNLYVDRMHVFIDFVDEQTLEIFQLYIFTNPSEYLLVPEVEGGMVVNFFVPPNTQNLYVEDNMSLAYQKTENGFGVANIYPDKDPYQTVFSYQVPYLDNEVDLSIPISMDANALILMAPGDGLKIRSEHLVDAGTQEFEGVVYSMFNGSNLITGETIDLSMSGRPANNTPIILTGEGPSYGLVIGLAGFGFALIIAGVFLWRRNKNTEEDREGIYEVDSPEDIMDAIIALDDQYKTGGLPEGAYRHRREELKHQLREILKSEA